MSKFLRIVVLLTVLASTTLVALPAQAGSPDGLLPVPGPCFEGPLLPYGARALYCVPKSGWNGDLVVYGHGYVAPNAPLDFYNLNLPDGTYLPDIVQQLGYAFATTSYRRNGLAFLLGVEDMANLTASFPGVTGMTPRRTYIVGPSEGGIVTALSIERNPQLYTAGLSLCGPVGDFRTQIDYWGDFRTLFDYFFPGVLPGTTIDIPDELVANWESQYTAAVIQALTANPAAALQLIGTANAPVDKKNLEQTIGETTLGVLWYNVFATKDGQELLNGNPYDNMTRIYRGSADDAALNAGVDRYAADPSALASIPPYDTTGKVTRPMVTMHTTGDPIVPYWHELLYRRKLVANGVTSVTQIPIMRYGHCNFTTTEVLAAFGLMVLQSTGKGTMQVPGFDTAATRAEIERAVQEFNRSTLR